jgi:hypothetical protein
VILYRLRNTREGRKRDEFASGEIHYADGSVQLDVPDRNLARSIQKHFQESFRVRAVRGSLETFLSHTWIDLLPGTEQHFDEGLRQLVRLNLIVEDGP